MNGSESGRRRLCLPAGATLAAALVLLLLPAPPVSAQRAGEPPTLWDHRDPAFEAGLLQGLTRAGLAGALRSKRLGVALVDVSVDGRPRVAALNGDDMFYAASLPKIAVMLAVFQKAATGGMNLDRQTWLQLVRMIRVSSNADSTALMHKVTKPYLAGVLLLPRYRLYDPSRGGGLWAGKDYGKEGLWRRDPLRNLSHAATAMQVARFFHLLDQGRLVSPEASGWMKEILGDTAIEHKFVKALRQRRPRVQIYRKSGTWRQFHSDAALVERRDGARYIAVALSESHQGARWLHKVVLVMDDLLTAPPTRLQVLTATAGG